MRLGDRPPHPLSHHQKRSIKLAVLVACVLVLGSVLIRASYREMPGIVVGNEIELSSAVEGTVATVHRRENESYRRGDKLVTLENGELSAQLDAVERDLDEITRSLAIEQSRDGFERRRFELENSIATDQGDLQTARAELESVDRQLPGLKEWRDLTEQRLQHGEELQAQGAITVTEVSERRRSHIETDSRYQEAVAKRSSLDGRVQRLTQVLALERQRLGRLTEERTAFITELELKRREKEGERDELKASIGRLDLVADSDGMVSKIVRRPGEFVHSGGPVLRVMRDEQLWVEAYLKVGEKRFVKPGDQVELVGVLPSGAMKGRVSNVRPKLEPFPGGSGSLRRPQNFVVLVVTLDDPEQARGVLTPAQQVTARIRRRLAWPGEDQAIANGVETPAAAGPPPR
jgi:membrane fusion protein (multidrug efflux system)